ncbi:MAG: EamA family transporter [Lachnospiraceae bacterium]|nr:EamA family transporter [Lachnospiraceae bacterium]
MKKTPRLRDYLFLHAIFLFYALGTVLTKYSGNFELWSWQFVLLYAVKILILAAYAFLWREALKRFELTSAYIQKTVTVIWSLLAGVILFEEVITWQKLAGSVIIIGGLYLAVSEHE